MKQVHVYLVFVVFCEMILYASPIEYEYVDPTSGEVVSIHLRMLNFNPCDYDENYEDCDNQPTQETPTSESFSVLILGPNDGICSGTLISGKHVLTAAHCFLPKGKCVPIHEMDVHPNDYTVHALGTCRSDSDKSCLETETKTTKFNVTEVYMLNEFLEKCETADLAILTLSVPDSMTLPYARFNPAAPNPTSGKFWVSGWGFNPIHPDQTANRVSSVNLNAAPCREPRYDYICVEEINTDACKGDSGAGFLSYEYIIGVVSYGADCTTLFQKSLMRLKNGEKRPTSSKTNGIFTSVNVHMEFICNVLETENCYVNSENKNGEEFTAFYSD